MTDTDAATLAVLEGGLTESQLAALSVPVGPFAIDGPDFDDLIFRADGLSDGQFAALCGFYRTLLDHDVSIRHLTATEEAVRLEYTTDSEAPDPRGAEIQRIAGCYASMFADDSVEKWVGGPLPDFHAQAETPQSGLSWRVQWSWAEELVAGDIDARTLLDRVSETVVVK